MSEAPDNPNSKPSAASASNSGGRIFAPHETVYECFENGWSWLAGCSPVIVATLLLATLPWTADAVVGPIGHLIWLLSGLMVPSVWSSCRRITASLKFRVKGATELESIGPYRLIRKLGAGGMGEVYLAEHELMKRQCAVKLIHPSRAANEDMQRSFEIEAKATAQLTHWNTIEIYDYGTSPDGRFYYVMEYLQGVNLRQFVENYGAMAPGRIIYLLKQLCESLYEAECQGLVHRDIKPSNIFMTQRGQSCDVAKLLDFGLVQEACAGSVKVEGANRQLKGSPGYMCPEQATGAELDHRGDLYSLGCVAYFLLSGRPPFLDENPVMLIVAHATMSAPSILDVADNVPDDLATIVMKCLARNPGDRFQSARDLLLALEQCESANDWNYRDAEDWWRTFDNSPEQQPSAENENELTNSISRATMQGVETTIVEEGSELKNDLAAEMETVHDFNACC